MTLLPYWLRAVVDDECADCTVAIDQGTPAAYLPPTERGEGGRLLCLDCGNLVEDEVAQQRAEAAR